MNVRIEEQNLRFKISEQELRTLIDGHCLSMKVGLLDKMLVVTINPQGDGDDMKVAMVFGRGEVYLNFLIPPEKLLELSEMGRSRAGLEANMDGLSLSLQVDLRSDQRKAKRA